MLFEANVKLSSRAEFSYIFPFISSIFLFSAMKMDTKTQPGLVIKTLIPLHEREDEQSLKHKINFWNLMKIN